MDMENKFVIVQPVSKKTWLVMTLKNILINAKTKYQNLAIVEFEEYKRGIVLDNLVQSTEEDEYIYHESLVHPALITHPNPQKILLIGGGEGAALREILKHATVKEVTMVDIDEDVLKFCQKYLERMHRKSFNDPRAKIVIADGREYIKRLKDNNYDVVILDLTDPYGPKISRELYSIVFYQEIKRILKDDGIMVTQAGSSFFYETVYDSVLSNLRSVFPIVREYNVWVPSYGYACNFIIGSKKYDPKTLSINEINKRIKERKIDTLFYSGETHIALFFTPIFRKKSYLVKKKTLKPA